jgi:putative two-component system response regulator
MEPLDTRGPRPRLLIVDDEPFNRDLLEGLSELLGYDSATASGGMEALTRLGPDIDLVLLDGMMPAMDGFEVARRMREHPTCGDIPIVMVTALSSKEDRLRAVEAGANDFITKPVDRTELRVRIASLLKMKAAQDALKRHGEELEATVVERTADLRCALRDVVVEQEKTHRAHLDTIQRLALAAEYRDGHTAAHLHRVAHYCVVLARALRLSPAQVETIHVASPMHDVGKLGIPDAILLKPGPLTDVERAVMQEHARIGARILGDSESALLQAGEVIALSHHEKWDGSGYPNGLAGEAIPIEGRICAVADVFDALTSRRPYKEAFPNPQAYKMMQTGRGTHFDAHILDLFFANLEEIVAIQGRFREQPIELCPPLLACLRD